MVISDRLVGVPQSHHSVFFYQSCLFFFNFHIFKKYIESKSKKGFVWFKRFLLSFERIILSKNSLRRNYKGTKHVFFFFFGCRTETEICLDSLFRAALVRQMNT